MDRLDIGILRTLGESGPPGLAGDPRVSLRKMARNLGVDKDTVNRRLKRLRDRGVLNGWAVVINPRVIGASITRLLLDLPEHSNKEDLTRKLKLIPGVVLLTTLHGDALEFILYYDNEKTLRKTNELVQRISNAEDLTRFDSFFPECRLILSKTDWELVRSIQEEPLKSYDQISKEMGISARTAKRRLTRLFTGMALVAYPRVDLTAMDATAVRLLVFYDDSKQAGEVNGKIFSRFGDRMFMAEMGARDHGFVILFVPNAAEVQEIATWTRSQPGVLRCRADIVQNHVEVPGALGDMLERASAQVRLPARA